MPASNLIEDLRTVPSIVGGLGLSVAAAQKALNLDYLESVGRCIEMIKLLPQPGGGADEARMTAAAILKQLTPSRYQFSETTLTVKLDLAQRMDMAGNVGLGVPMGAVAINAAFSFAYGYDYRAAAEVKTVLHAMPADTNVFDKLIARSAGIGQPTLPAAHPVDADIKTAAENVVKALTPSSKGNGGTQPKPLTADTPPAKPADGADKPSSS